jgi:hypothetical protein
MHLRYVASFALATLVAVTSSCRDELEESGSVCADFSCQGQAQAWHNANPSSGLDGDGDGIACEGLPRCSVLASLGSYDGGIEDSVVTFTLTIDAENLTVDGTVPIDATLVIDGEQHELFGELDHRTAWLQTRSGPPLCLQLDTEGGVGTILSIDWEELPSAARLLAWKR